MVQLVAFRRSLVGLALCTVAIAATSTPASARSHHGRHVHVGRTSHHQAARHHVHHHQRHAARASRWQRSVALTQSRGVADANASYGPDVTYTGSVGGGFSSIVAEARRYIGGGNPTGRARLWCARFMNMVLQRTGYRGTNSDMARSFASYGRRVSGPQVGAIAVMTRRGGGHVGVVSGVDADGDPIIVSGNNGNAVREAPVSRARVYAYVMPTT
jgi:uncharacterized protein (TIGR02594 family)